MDETKGLKDYIDRATCKNLEMAKNIQLVAKHHIESFNFIYEGGLDKVCEYLQPIEILKEMNDSQESSSQIKSALPFGKMKIWFEELSIGLFSFLNFNFTFSFHKFF